MPYLLPGLRYRAGSDVSMFETGVACRSGARANPIEHLLVYVGNRWVTWCGGGPAIKGFVSVTRRRCPKCRTLAIEDLVDGGVEPDESSEFDWFLGRRLPRDIV